MPPALLCSTRNWAKQVLTTGIALVVRLAGGTSTSYAIHRLAALLSAISQPVRSIGGAIGELRSLATFAVI